MWFFLGLHLTRVQLCAKESHWFIYWRWAETLIIPPLNHDVQNMFLKLSVKFQPGSCTCLPRLWAMHKKVIDGFGLIDFLKQCEDV